MVFRICLYCNEFESDERKLHSRINKNGTITICNIHISCKEEKRAKSIERNTYKPVIKEKKTILDKINNIPEKKYCSKCEKDKYISEFYSKKDFTHAYYCKECSKESTVKWKLNNNEKVTNYQKQYNKTYGLENKDKIREYNRKYIKKWYAENKERVNEKKRLKYQEKKEKDRVYIENLIKSKKSK